MPIKIELESSGGHGILLPEIGIGLDTRYAGSYVQVITHAHSDHVPSRSNKPVLATPATIDLMQARGFKGEVQKLPFFEPFKTSKATITLFPAGHILGSAQVFVETENGNVLYTGDFKRPASPTSEGCFFPDKPIDIFIAEATFGLPIYKWKSDEVLEHEIVSFAQSCLSQQINPVFLAYNLGKAQEIMFYLAKAQISMQIHEAGFELCKVYEKYGFDLGDYERLNPKTASGKALIMPSFAADSSKVSKGSKQKIAYVSGWACLESRMQQMAIHKRIALSDHLDFYELISVVKKLNPAKTYITHSPNPEIMCHFLQEEGFDAEPLESLRIKEEKE